MSNERDELAELPASQLAFMAALKTGDAAPGDGRAFRTGFDAALSWKLPPRPRTVTTAAELDALPHGSVLLTSDYTDTALLKDGSLFRNQSGAELTTGVLLRFGTQPFTVLYEPAA